MTLVDARPAGLDLFFRPGNAFEVTLEWPADVLDGRTFTAALDGDSIDVQVADDTMTLSVDAELTSALVDTASFTLTEDGNDLLVGRWGPSFEDGTTSVGPLQVTLEDTTVTVDVLGTARTVRLPATVIAAFDAPEDVRARADVVCDGVDDNVEIQAACEEGPVLLSAGTFNINGMPDQRLTLPSNTVLRGQGPQQTVIKLQPVDLSNETNFPGLLSWGVIMTADDDENLTYDVTIADLTVDGNSDNMLGDGNENQAECINIKYARRVKISNVHVQNGNADGLDMDLSSGEVINFSALNCRGNGIHLSGGFPAGADGTASRWVTVTNADIEACGYGFNRNAFDVTSDSAFCVYQGIHTRDCYAAARISGNYNVVNDVTTDDERGITVEGDYNTVSNAVIQCGGINTALIFSSGSTGNKADQVVLIALKGFACNGSNHTLVGVTEVTAAASTLEAASSNIRVIGGFHGVVPTSGSSSSRFHLCRTSSAASEARGSGTIADGQSTATVTHGVWASPTSVVATPRANTAIWISARTSTTFTVSRSGTSGALTFDWEALL